MISPLQKLSVADLRALVDAVKSGHVCAPYTAVSMQRYVASADTVHVAAELQRFSDLGMSKEALIVAIELLSNERERQVAHEDCIDLVWTGPEADGVPSRNTSVVVREMFATAGES